MDKQNHNLIISVLYFYNILHWLPDTLDWHKSGGNSVFNQQVKSIPDIDAKEKRV